MAELKLENSIVDDRYYVERSLGCGSYAEIFVAHDQRHNHLPVIIKALNTSLQGTPDVELERTLVENFQNEAIALDKVRHPFIIRRLGHGSAADLTGKVFHYLVLEYMPGGDLLSLCSRRPLPLSQASVYFEQVAEALAYAHSQQVIHRDIKPKNLLLSENHEVVKIADFGVAKMTQVDGDYEITRVGTNVYAPPEHHPDSDSDMMHEKLTPSADVYSLAKTIYTAMTGRAPRQFSRKPISSLPAELTGEVWGQEFLRVLQKATAMRVAERYASIHQFWEDFAKLNSLAPSDETDETTVVRKRLTGTSDEKQTASLPDFQAATAAVSRRSPQQARIVVDLPVRNREPEAKHPQPGVGNQGAEHLAAPKADNRQAPAAAPAHNGLHNQLVQQNGGLEKRPENYQTRKMGGPRAVERDFFDTIRAFIRSDWLRRAFIVFLIAALIGIVASVYFRFAGQRSAPSLLDLFTNKYGVIDGVVNGKPLVNAYLRSEPDAGSAALRMLPQGTKVRALEEQKGWVRVKVTELPSGSVSDGVDTGWVLGRYVQFN